MRFDFYTGNSLRMHLKTVKRISITLRLLIAIIAILTACTKKCSDNFYQTTIATGIKKATDKSTCSSCIIAHFYYRSCAPSHLLLNTLSILLIQNNIIIEETA